MVLDAAVLDRPADGVKMAHDPALLTRAFELARKSFDEGGCPIGSVLARGPLVLGEGHNQRVQRGDPIAHRSGATIELGGRSGKKTATAKHFAADISEPGVA